MKKLTNKLLISIMSAVLAVIALGATTFAWFTLSNQATLQPFEGRITAGEGIEISLDGVTWYSTITTDIMHGYLFDGYIDGNGVTREAVYPNFKFKEVTTSDGVLMKSYNGTPFVEDNLSTLPYLKITLLFRSPAVSDIYLDNIEFPDAFNTTDLSVNWQPDAPFRTAKGEDLGTDVGSARDYYAKDAARASVATASKVLVYEAPDSDTNTVLSGLTNANLLPFMNGEVLDYPALYWGAIDYFYQKNNDFPTGADNVSVVQTVTIDSSDETQKLITLVQDGNYYSGTVHLRIWIEGWDPDCFNAILSARLAVTLRFIGK